MKLVLCCGSGASSGFMATSIKKAAKKKEMDIEVFARSESLIENFLDGTDLVLIAPHLKAEVDELAKKCTPVPCMLIDNRSYGMLDGEGVLNQALETLKTHTE